MTRLTEAADAVARYPRYSVELYHDEPENAATDSRSLGRPYVTETDAIDAARLHLDGYWQTASIHVGTAHFSHAMVRFENDEQAMPTRVGPDWIER